jgi:hypothetical protein
MNSRPRSTAGSWLAAFTIVAGALIMWPFGKLHYPGSVPPFLIGAAIMMAGYFLALRGNASFELVAVVAVVIRILLLGQAPGDDIYRYIWEGRLILERINPYLHAPDAERLIALRDYLWEAVEHKSITAIYPPLAEWLFAAMTWIGGSVLVCSWLHSRSPTSQQRGCWRGTSVQKQRYFMPGIRWSSIPLQEGGTTTVSLSWPW